VIERRADLKVRAYVRQFRAYVRQVRADACQADGGSPDRPIADHQITRSPDHPITRSEDWQIATSLDLQIADQRITRSAITHSTSRDRRFA
jgi:hypothetical protein